MPRSRTTVKESWTTEGPFRHRPFGSLRLEVFEAIPNVEWQYAVFDGRGVLRKFGIIESSGRCAEHMAMYHARKLAKQAKETA